MIDSLWRLCAGLLSAAVLVGGCTTQHLAQVTRPAPAATEAAPEEDADGTAHLEAPAPEVAVLAFAATEPAPAAPASDIEGLIAHYAALYDIPASLLHRVVRKESGYNPAARNGPYYGLMQIRQDTARTMGFRGHASALLDADTNLRYGARYLAGAYKTAGGNADQAMRFYARGYYYDAKRKGLLDEVGLR